ncbi:hypothetical protein DFH08DRAFT_819900 [Mycena albidolilacea]|uniref:Uncharacterized protein n=1 Tax=Mycena albidolilacea TaxID=1033008 RepID=A0AAD6ZD93_9AGAR|nr:hypothetical protein DFH08DRAFT_819900 [Mycena albidolilacea]
MHVNQRTQELGWAYVRPQRVPKWGNGIVVDLSETEIFGATAVDPVGYTVVLLPQALSLSEYLGEQLLRNGNEASRASVLTFIRHGIFFEPLERQPSSPLRLNRGHAKRWQEDLENRVIPIWRGSLGEAACSAELGETTAGRAERAQHTGMSLQHTAHRTGSRVHDAGQPPRGPVFAAPCLDPPRSQWRVFINGGSRARGRIFAGQRRERARKKKQESQATWALHPRRHQAAEAGRELSKVPRKQILKKCVLHAAATICAVGLDVEDESSASNNADGKTLGLRTSTSRTLAPFTSCGVGNTALRKIQRGWTDGGSAGYILVGIIAPLSPRRLWNASGRGLVGDVGGEVFDYIELANFLLHVTILREPAHAAGTSTQGRIVEDRVLRGEEVSVLVSVETRDNVGWMKTWRSKVAVWNFEE